MLCRGISSFGSKLIRNANGYRGFDQAPFKTQDSLVYSGCYLTLRKDKEKNSAYVLPQDGQTCACLPVSSRT
jgi:hypothetical protein